MKKLLEIDSNIGDPLLADSIVANGLCPFCNHRVAFRQIDGGANSHIQGNSVAMRCDFCHSVVSYSGSENKIHPSPVHQKRQDLPTEINRYYTEALNCLEAHAPNGAATLFRKLIHQLGIHYDIATINEQKNLYTIINDLHDHGHITSKLKDALLAVKDIGNDGAHVNQNEPNMNQIEQLKQLIDSVLESTIVADQNVQSLRRHHNSPSEGT